MGFHSPPVPKKEAITFPQYSFMGGATNGFGNDWHMNWLKLTLLWDMGVSKDVARSSNRADDASISCDANNVLQGLTNTGIQFCQILIR
jgi:hypothetical protein